jgi:hypothetical protein
VTASATAPPARSPGPTATAPPFALPFTPPAPIPVPVTFTAPAPNPGPATFAAPAPIPVPVTFTAPAPIPVPATFAAPAPIPVPVTLAAPAPIPVPVTFGPPTTVSVPVPSPPLSPFLSLSLPTPGSNRRHGTICPDGYGQTARLKKTRSADRNGRIRTNRSRPTLHRRHFRLNRETRAKPDGSRTRAAAPCKGNSVKKNGNDIAVILIRAPGNAWCGRIPRQHGQRPDAQ